MICFCSLARKSYEMPWSAWIILGAGLGALATAFTAQFVFHLDPCILCLWERVPYGAAALFVVPALFLRGRAGIVRACLVLACLAFVANVGLSAFHSGVERHWWKGTDECAVETNLEGQSPEALRLALLATPTARCDQIDWSLAGLSLTNFNVLACLALALFAGLAAGQVGKKPQEAEGAMCCCGCKK